MTLFSGPSIRQKLNAILVITTALALGLAGFAMVMFDLRNQARTIEKNLLTQADIIGLASGSALAFDDRNAATENLSVLRASNRVATATLFDKNGTPFATYQSAGLPVALPLPKAPAAGVVFDNEWVAVSRRVMLNQETLGTVHLQAQHELSKRFFEYLIALVFILASSLAAALLLSNRLLRRVTAPILAVSAVAQGVLAKGDFNLRAEKTTNDEAGALVDAFNAMLEELGRRASTLVQANEALRASEERFQLAVRGSSAGLWDWDMLAKTTFYSPRFKALLGYTDAEFPNVPGSVRPVVHVDDWHLLKKALRDHLDNGQPYQVECRMHLKNGQWAWFLMAGIAQKNADGVPYRMAGSIIDITERKEAERALKEADRAKDAFIATLAHELRNPLAPIRTGLDVLRRDTSNGPASERTREIMERQLMHMVRLIDDLLDISRIASGKIWLEKSPVQLRSVIESSLELSAPAIAAGKHELVVQLPDNEIELYADSTRLAQAVGNLLNNAAKYTPKGGKIRLRVWQDDATAVISVEDNGVGIAADMLEKVFSLFAQVDRTMNRSQNGLGIGLSLVRSFIELHGGSVIATSPGLDLGSTFTIRIPCESERQAMALFADDQTSKKTITLPRKVLVVDDNVDAADTIAAALNLRGYETRTLYDGPPVHAATLEFGPDVVLLDIGLPGMSGQDVAHKLRADANLKHVLLVALTGWGSDADRRATRSAGFDHHLTKPVGIDSLDALLSEALAAPKEPP